MFGEPTKMMKMMKCTHTLTWCEDGKPHHAPSPHHMPHFSISISIIYFINLLDYTLILFGS